MTELIIGYRVIKRDIDGSYIQVGHAIFRKKEIAEMLTVGIPKQEQPLIVEVPIRAPNYDLISPTILVKMHAYINNHEPTGDFLRAVLENNLSDAFSRADDWNRETLFDIVGFVYNEAPRACWGSPAKVDTWLAAYVKKT